ncbi:MAG: hypothetical protein LBJ24_02615, partial [Treponema sp.]|nr:hypothetical protein [Treponema sp.]
MPDFSVVPYPGLLLPLGDPVFDWGMGGAAALDMAFLPYLGATVQGEGLSLRDKGGDSTLIYGFNLGPSLSWRPVSRFGLKLDLTGGLYTAQRKEQRLSGISAGVNLQGIYHISPYLSFIVHGGYKYYGSQPDPLLQGINAGIGFSIHLSEINSRKIRIEAKPVNSGMVFPVSYAWYNDNPFMTVRITNRETNDITTVNTSFYLEQYMNQPKFCGTHQIIRPGETVEVPITAFFNEAMLELTENITANAMLILEYRSLGAQKRVEIPLELPIYHRNAMTWDDDRRASSFVSPRDPAALWFSRYVSSMILNRLRPEINRNIQTAIGLFEALNIYGINYVVDPNSSYVELSESTSSLDSLNYPYQTLLYRGGDCDDLSILFCSLLEAAGINTAFITIPGHIYMAFSSGMTEEEAKQNFYAPDLLIYQDGMAWVPLEITLPKGGFYRAWRVGAKEWSDADARGEAHLYPMEDSWNLYPPVNVPGAVSRFILPGETVIAGAFDRSVDTYIDFEIRPRLRSYENRLAQGEDPEIRNELGILYGRYGMLSRAAEHFARCAESGYIHGWVNLGNIAFLERRYQDAIWYYQQVLAREPANALAILGLSRSYYELNEFGYSDTYYAELRRRDQGLARNYAYLASFFESRGRAFSLSEYLFNASWSRPEAIPIQLAGLAPEVPPVPAIPGIPAEPPASATQVLTPADPVPEPISAPPPPEPMALPPPIPAVTPGGRDDTDSDPEDPESEDSPPVPPEPPAAAVAAADPVLPPAPDSPVVDFPPESEPEEIGGLSGMLSIGGARLQSVQGELLNQQTAPPQSITMVPLPEVSVSLLPTAPVPAQPVEQAPESQTSTPVTVVPPAEPAPIVTAPAPAATPALPPLPEAAAPEPRASAPIEAALPEEPAPIVTAPAPAEVPALPPLPEEAVPEPRASAPIEAALPEEPAPIATAPAPAIIVPALPPLPEEPAP